MKSSHAKIVLVVALVCTFTVVAAGLNHSLESQTQGACPLLEKEGEFVLSNPDFYLTVESDHGTPGGEGWYLDDTTAYANLDTDIVAGVPGVRYVFTNWAGDATGTNYAQSDPITMDANKTAIAFWKTQYYLTVNSAHGTPSGSGWKDAGTTATAHLDTGIESGGLGVQYVFTNWIDDSTGTDYSASDDILMNGPKVATANWKTQYMLDVQSDHGSPSGTGWKDAGSVVYAGLDAGIVAGTTGTQYVFTGWSGDATGSDYASSDSIVMNAPKTAIANWKTQYYLTIESDHATTSGEGWKDEGSVVYASLDTDVVTGGTGTQYVFTNWAGDATGTVYTASDSILMNNPKTATAVWKTQHYLTVESDHGTPSGEGWKDSGTSVIAALDTNIVSGGSGVRYVFTNWAGDATGTNYAASDLISMDGPKTATAFWRTQFYLTVSTAHGTPSGEGWKDAGNVAYAHLDTGLVSGGTGTQYVFTNWIDDSTGTDYATSDDILMNGPKTATASWKTQYFFDVQSDQGSPTGSGWKDAGTSVSAGLDVGIVAGTTGIQYVFTSWGGDVTGSDYTASDSIVMNTPKTAVANWKTQYYLTVNSDHAITSGEGWKDEGTYAVASVDTATVAGGPGSQLAFTSWSGDATGSDYSGSDPILMDSPRTASAVWITQYMLTATSSHGILSGDGWQDEGTVAYLALDSDIVSGETGTRYMFTNWGGDATGTNYATSDGILMDAPKSATAVWKTQYYLTVTTAYGTPSGEGWKDTGLTVTAHLDSGLVSGGVGIQYVFTIWSGDASGNDYSTSDDIIMDSPKTAVANWQTQYFLTITTLHGSPSGDGWFNDSLIANVGLDTGLVPGLAGIQYVFTSWSGDASGTNYSRSEDILMDGPKSAVANWQTQYQLNCTTEPAGLLPEPTKIPSGTWFEAGINVTLEAQEIDGYTFRYWTIDDLEAAILSRVFNLTMDAPHSVIAFYEETVTTPTTITTITTTSGTQTPPPDGDNTMILVLIGGASIGAVVILVIIILKKRSG